MGSHVFQSELGLPSVTLIDVGGVKARATSLVALIRYGLGGTFELRLGGPVYTRTRVDIGSFTATDSGYGDLEVGVKWRASANGFVRGMDMRRDSWADLMDDEEQGGALIPILARAHEHHPEPEMRP